MQRVYLITDRINTVHDAFIAFIIVINKKYFLITFTGTVARFDIPFAQNTLLNQGDLWMLGSTMMILSSWCLLFCRVWVEKTRSLLWSFCFSGQISLCEMRGYCSWQGFWQDWSQWEHQRAYMKRRFLFCWWWPVQLGKGHFNISLDLFSGIQIINEYTL